MGLFYKCVFVVCRFTKPQTFADCIGNELPLGWEEAYDPQIGSYYINHVNREYAVTLFVTALLLHYVYSIFNADHYFECNRTISQLTTEMKLIV